MSTEQAARPEADNAATGGHRFAELIRLSNRNLNQVLRAGVVPDLDGLVGWEFRGYNTPWFSRLLGFQKFIKGFRRDERGIYGYNLFVEAARSGPDAPWNPKAGGGPDRRHGYYDITPLPADSEIQGVLLDYGSGRNAWYNPEALIRDQLVQVDAGNPDLLLGKAYLAFGPLRIFSNFFVLERLQRAPDA